MSVLINAHKLTHSFGGRNLFEGLTFSLNTDEKTALIGANGAGKSTLFKIMSGKLSPDSGNLSRTKGLKIGIVEQVPVFPAGKTVYEIIFEPLESYAHDSGEWDLLHKAEKILQQLGIMEDAGSPSTVNKKPVLEQPIEQLSGGWQKKVALAKELVMQPDLLLLDEPTNHLDLESILWLEEWIQNTSSSVLIISHDREFLRKTATRTIEIDRKNPDGILSVDGGYDQFLTVKEEYLAGLISREQSLSNTLRRETEWLRRGAKARTTKQKARIDRAGDLGKNVQDLRSKLQTGVIEMDFQTQENQPKKLIEAEKISKSYNGRKLFENLSLKITPKTRLGLLGANGAGKSTLIKLLVGNEQPDQGSVFINERLNIAYFEQKRDRLDLEKTVLRTLCPTGETVEFQNRQMHIRSYLDRFVFTQQQMDLKVGKLSGGEQSRLLIAELMLQPANLLILDEPTNDLDLSTLDILEQCLEEFPGAVILVSHDRAFLDSVCTELLSFPEMLRFHGMDQWTEWKKNQITEATKPQKRAASSETKAEKSAPAPTSQPPTEKAKKLSYKEEKELEQMAGVVHELDEKIRLEKMRAQELDFTKDHKLIHEKMVAIAHMEDELEKLYSRWSELDQRKKL